VLGAVALPICLSFGWYTQVYRQALFGMCLRFDMFWGLKFYLPFLLFCAPGCLFSAIGSWMFFGLQTERQELGMGKLPYPNVYGTDVSTFVFVLNKKWYKIA
jgi:hypothetical protein